MQTPMEIEMSFVRRGMVPLQAGDKKEHCNQESALWCAFLSARLAARSLICSCQHN